MTKDCDRHGMHLVPDTGYQSALEQLMTALEKHHPGDPELHQLYLETQWLLSNQKSGSLVLPTSWDLIVFRLADSDKLKQIPKAQAAAKEIVRLVRLVAHCDDNALTG